MSLILQLHTPSPLKPLYLHHHHHHDVTITTSATLRLTIKSQTSTTPQTPDDDQSPPPPPQLSKKPGLGFGSTSTTTTTTTTTSNTSSSSSNTLSKKKKPKKGSKRERASIIRRSPVINPGFVSREDETKAKEVQRNESAFLLAWLGLGGIILIEGIALAASGFLPEEWDKFFVKYLYPSFTPTVFLFVAGTVAYGVLKYLQNESPKGKK